MTDVADAMTPAWKASLQAVARASGHEMRNALNGLVVNLEVVRTINAASGVSAEPFIGQAVAQAEESVRLAESTIALLGLVIGAIGPDAAVRCEALDRNDLSFEAGENAERLSNALQPLAVRGVLSAETSGSAVILRIAEDRPELIEPNE